MKKGRPKKQEIVLTDLERKTLVELTRSLKAPHSLVMRAGIVLSSADGEGEHFHCTSDGRINADDRQVAQTVYSQWSCRIV